MRVSIVAISLLLSVGAGEAACRTGPFNFQFGQSAASNAQTSYSHGGEDCLLAFRGGGQTAYESITPSRSPSNGTLTRHSSGMGYIYKAKAGYKGQDAFSLRVCGKGATSNGCNTVNYAVTIQ